MADRRLNQNQAERFLSARPVVTRSADDPPQPQCPACGAFVAEDAQYAPNTCGNCEAELPPDPAKAAKGKRPAMPWRVDRVWIEAIADSMARHTKAAFDHLIAERDAQIVELQREVAALKTKRTKRLKAAT